MKLHIKIGLFFLVTITTNFLLYGVDPIPLSNASAVGGIITLNASGNYQVVEDLVYPVVINVNTVSLNLYHHTITYDSSVQSLITVNQNLSAVTIFNGQIYSTAAPGGSGSGVLVHDGAFSICLQDLKIFNCGYGVRCAGISGNEIVTSELLRLDLVANATGVVCEYTDETVIKECSAVLGTYAGFALLNSEANCLYACQVVSTQGSQSVAAFLSQNGSNNLFKHCVAKQTKTSSTTFGDAARGLMLTGTETKTKIIDCVINETDVISSAMALTYGIQLAPTLNAVIGEAPGFPAVTGYSTIYALRWSPDSRYMAVCWSNGAGSYGVDIFSWNGSDLVYITGVTTSSTQVTDVSWSPEGKYIVAVDNDGQKIYTYSFDGSRLSLIGSPFLAGRNSFSVKFSPNGKYIAVICYVGGGGEWIQIYSFNPESGTPLTQLTNQSISTLTCAFPSLSWSPDGRYIVMAVREDFIPYNIIIADVSIPWNLSFFATYSFPGATGVVWSPCGKYIVTGSTTGEVRVVLFDGTNLTTAAQSFGLSSGVHALDWSPDGKYIVAASHDVSSNLMRILAFTGTTLSIAWQSSPVTVQGFVSLHWSAQGNSIVAAELNNKIHMINALYGPQSCLIDSCRVADTQASNFNMGRGIVGTGKNNTFLNNIASYNQVNYSCGIPNVYYGRFDIERHLVQPFDNISAPTTA